MKMAARIMYQQMRQGAYKNIITHIERFNNALKAYIDQGNPRNLEWTHPEGNQTNGELKFYVELSKQISCSSSSSLSYQLLQPIPLN